MDSWEIFQKKYQEISPELRSFIDSEEISNFAQSLQSTFQRGIIDVPEIITTLVDVILDLATAETALPKLSTDQITQEQKQQLEQEVRAFLQKVPGGVAQSGAAGQSPIALETNVPIRTNPAQTQTSTAPTSSPATPRQPQAAEPVTHSPQVITPSTTGAAPALSTSRTMQGDIASIQRGGEAVPRYAKPLTETPRYENNAAQDPSGS